MALTRTQRLELYYWMRLTRSLEERLVNLYRQTKVIGGLFRSLGQEADSVGSAYALDRSPSGSSSGTGVAVSANLCAVGVGTETDGSVVSPSSAS